MSDEGADATSHPVRPNLVNTTKSGMWVPLVESGDDELDNGDCGGELDNGEGGLSTGTMEGVVEHAAEIACRGVEATAKPHQRQIVKLPSIAEQLHHRRTHIHFRPWCPDRVAGRKPNWGHYIIPVKAKVRDYPEIHFDYCFFRARPGGDSAFGMMPCVAVMW